MKEMMRARARWLVGGAVLLLAAGIVGASFFNWHWWKNGSNAYIAEIPERTGGQPLRFDGVVTYYAHAVAVLQDETSGIAVSVPGNAALRVGQRILVAGILPKGYDPTAPVPLALEHPQFTVLEEHVALPLRKVKAGELYESFEPIRVEVTGILKSAGEWNNRMRLGITSGSKSISVIVNHGGA